jgi:hypothetical protein
MGKTSKVKFLKHLNPVKMINTELYDPVRKTELLYLNILKAGMKKAQTYYESN